MFFELLNTAIGPLKVKVWLGILALAGVIVGAWITIAENRDRRMVDEARTSGAATTVIEQQRGTIEQVEKANEAQQRIDLGGDSERHARCLRNATPATRANCARFERVPDRP